LASGESERGDVNTLARALWRRRHPDLLPAVRRSLEQLTLPAPTALHGLLVLLEKSPDALRTWAADPSVPVSQKTEVLTVLTEEVPDALASTLAAFISTAHTLFDSTERAQEDASDYCEALLSLLLRHWEQRLPLLPNEVLSTLRAWARWLVADAALLNCSIRAAVLLKHIGQSEDAALLDAHRPTEPVLARVFEEAAHALRQRGGGERS
jgi:hypothetical protein